MIGTVNDVRAPEVITAIAVLRDRLRQIRRDHPAGSDAVRVGLVPTMGYLHQGHASLFDKARESCDVVVASIFVNPLQFGPNEDYARYPRDLERDLRIAREARVDIVFAPDAAEMYPREPRTKVQVTGLTDRLCGATRPGHFDGVATVVCKLFNLVQPQMAFFGMKDAQQISVIEQMTADLNIPVTIVPCPTIRESDGLAMSSRNRYLNPQEREQAVRLSGALRQVASWLEVDGPDADKLIGRITEYIGQAPDAAMEYVEMLTYPELQPISDLSQVIREKRRWIVALAVKFGRTRLIDNILMQGGIGVSARESGGGQR